MLVENSSVEIQKLYNEGIWLLPVHETLKEPVGCGKWKERKRFEILELFDTMTSHKTQSIAYICGVKSGNLFCIDVDTKHYEGFDGILFPSIIESYPHIWKKLRIEQTPSGGYHLLYRIELDGNEFPKSPRLASNEKGDKFFLETKGEGGLCQSYPSPNYKRISGDKLQILTWSEHQSLICLCRTYNQKSKVDETRPSREISDYYEKDKDPYKEFDRSLLADDVLTDTKEWFYYRTSGNYDLFYKKGNKDYDTGATFDRVKRIYKIHTTSTDLEDKSFTPSSILCHYQFNGDKKALKTYLEEKGFGVIKPYHERRIIKNRVVSGLPLPLNFSEQGKKEFEIFKENIDKLYPYGIFWNKDDKGNVEISQNGVDNVIKGMGYKFHNGKIYKIDNNEEWLLKTKNDQDVFHSLLMYIKEEQIKEVYDPYSKFIVKYGKLTIERLKIFCKLEEDKILESTKFISYKFYKNCYVVIDKNGYEYSEYKSLDDKLVFEDNIINREYVHIEDANLKNGKMYEFLDKAIGVSKNLLETIGYLCHDFIDDSMNAIIVASEKCANPKRGGGSGKNLLFNLLNHATSVHVMDGRQLELKNSLLQSFNGERILVLSDVEEKFDYSFFKNFSSGASSLKKLYQDVVVLKRKQMPKPVVLTNFSYEITAGLERRIIPIEFTEFFSRIRGGVATHFGCMFPSYDEKGDWVEEDWNCFDALIITSIFNFLKATQLRPVPLSQGGWEKQFIQVHKEPTYHFIQENIGNFIEQKRIDTLTFDQKYEEFCRQNKIRDLYRKSAGKLNDAFEDYCNYYKILFLKNQTWKENGVAVKGRVFGESIDIVDEPFDLF